MATIQFCGKQYEVKVRAPSFSEGWSASFVAFGELHGARGAETEEDAIARLHAEIADEHMAWVSRNPHHGTMPFGIMLGKVVGSGYCCNVCGGDIYFTNVPGVKTCADCGASVDVNGDYISRSDVERYALHPNRILEDDVISSIF